MQIIATDKVYIDNALNKSFKNKINLNLPCQDKGNLSQRNREQGSEMIKLHDETHSNKYICMLNASNICNGLRVSKLKNRKIKKFIVKNI